jgi:two-component system LytT family response regulator
LHELVAKNRSMKNRNTSYWSCQIGGWSAFSALGLTTAAMENGWRPSIVSTHWRPFEVSALDYLVKPVVPARLAAAVTKLRPRQDRVRLERVFVKEGERCWLVRVSDILLLESEGNYTRLHFAKERPLVCRSLASLEERLESRNVLPRRPQMHP